ncbi:MAG: serine hydrolase [Phycisphaerales bacterium JB050]
MAPEQVEAPTTARVVLDWAVEVLSGRSTEDLSDRFDPDLLEQFPAELPDPKAVNALIAAHQGLFGEGEAVLQGVRPTPDEKGLIGTLHAPETDASYDLIVAIDPETDLVNGFLITVAKDSAAIPADWPSIDRRLRSLPGELSVLVARVAEGGELERVYAITPEKRLAIGSAFKLWILGALAELVEEGQASWDEPLALNPDLKTMPIGVLATEAGNKGLGRTASFPLSRFANEMISVSDNPATDHLLERVGRDRVIAFMSRVHGKPELNQPFLSTGQMFKLKRGAPEEVLRAYIEAETPDQRQAVLDSDEYRDAVISIPLAMRWQKDGPIAIDRVEWFASATDLARTMIELRRMESRDGMEPLAHALRINDGIHLDDTDWPSVSYKGGSEPGVLNLTFLADAQNGETWFVSLGWNNPDAVLNEDTMIFIGQAIFKRLAGGDLPE